MANRHEDFLRAGGTVSPVSDAQSSAHNQPLPSLLEDGGDYLSPRLASTSSKGSSNQSDALGISPSQKHMSRRVSLQRVPVGSKNSSPPRDQRRDTYMMSAVPEAHMPQRELPGGDMSERRTMFQEHLPMQPVSLEWDPSPPAGETVVSPNDTLVGQVSPGYRSGFRWHSLSKNPSRHLSRAFRAPFTSFREREKDSINVEQRALSNSSEDGVEDDDEEIFRAGFESPPNYCSAREDIHMGRRRGLPIIILILSIYSTAMSTLWLCVSIIQPRWGHRISSKAGLQPSTATLITALAAKTIELSFVTVFVAFLGQILSRRSIIGKRGTTLAEINMRGWVIQPGTLLTQPHAARHAAWSILGVFCVLATLAAMLYTSASDAMVAPKLKYGAPESTTLAGYVQSSYANAQYALLKCPSLLKSKDNAVADESCINSVFSGQSYRDLVTFLDAWSLIYTNGSDSRMSMDDRPSGVNLFNGNTTVSGTWIEKYNTNMTESFAKTGYIVNNVTMAMPHPGVAAAAVNPVNGIMQPEDLSGVGEYVLKAGTVAPSVNTLCVNVPKSDIAPLVYTEWPVNHGKTVTVPLDWQKDVPGSSNTTGGTEYLNRTKIDDIFKWGPAYGRRPPVFSRFPIASNIVTNVSVPGSDSIYVLATKANFANYTVCQMRSYLSPNCSTTYAVSGTGGSALSLHCEDPSDPNIYLKSFPRNQDWNIGTVADWKWLAQQWTLATDLNGGFNNANASNAQILTEMVLEKPALLGYSPSIAEGLSVFAGITAVQGAVGSPFVHYWQYNKPGNILADPGDLQKFNATLASQQYTSGHVEAWKGTFFPVLIIVVALNFICLFFFLIKGGLITDYTEPLNLFTIALNSPPSQKLKGSCGGGPKKYDLLVPWRVAHASASDHYFFTDVNSGTSSRKWETLTTAKMDATSSLGSKRSYQRVSNTKDWF